MRLKTLNGAPLQGNLNFSTEFLLDPEAAARYLYGGLDGAPGSEGTGPELKWRRLASADTRLHTGWSQPFLPAGAFHGSNPNASFSIPDLDGPSDLHPDDTTFLDQTVTILDDTVATNDFVQHSLHFHDTLLSSQLAAPGIGDQPVSSSSFLTSSFESTRTSKNDQSDRFIQVPILHVPPKLTLTPLALLPSAAHVRSIYPQTPTPNLLCVLLAAPADREIFVKKGSYKMNLCEITVADDTKSGFRITFWNRPTGQGDAQRLNQTLHSLKIGDILLLRNIALNSYRDDVYGQSLNPSIARVRTTVNVLSGHRGMSDRQLSALPAPIVAAFMKVKRWASAHVASDNAGLRKRKTGRDASSRNSKRVPRSSDLHNDTLPPDTMEAD